VETAQAVCHHAIVGVVGWQFHLGHVEQFATLLMRRSKARWASWASWLSLGVGLLLVVILFALIDLPVQKFLHGSGCACRTKRSSASTRKRRRPACEGPAPPRQRELAQRNSIGAVPKADLVVMNPTHYAVAIRYDDATMAAPRVIAKGADLLAMKIRDVAREHKVPVLQSPMLARALYAHAEIDDEIPSALYTAVAQVLAYVYQLKAALARARAPCPATCPVPQVPPELDPHNKKPAKARTEKPE
jgi:flagellar biosynthesis protein FlhB